MTEPLWTILITTIGRRRSSFAYLLNVLLPQTESYNGDVTVCALWNNGERLLSEYRQQLVTDATSRYVSFVDDDDDVPYYYVSKVVDKLQDDRDQVGWQMQCTQDGHKLKPTFHSIIYNGWFEDDNGYYRDVSHLNPVKREIALKCDFRRGEPPEDVSWVNQVREHVHTESYISDIMYYYIASSVDSTWRPGSVQRGNDERLEINHPNFSYHHWSYLP